MVGTDHHLPRISLITMVGTDQRWGRISLSLGGGRSEEVAKNGRKEKKL